MRAALCAALLATLLGAAGAQAQQRQAIEPWEQEEQGPEVDPGRPEGPVVEGEKVAEEKAKEAADTDAVDGEPGMEALPGDPDAEAGAEAPAEPPADPNRPTFQLPFPAERGGGTATGNAGTIEYREEGFAFLSGGVEIRYQDTKVQADRIQVDLNTREIQADGDVIIDQGPQRLTGDSARWSLKERTGVIQNATAYVDPDFYFEGAEVAKVGEVEYHIEQGMFTACKVDDEGAPDWSFRVREADVELEGYARIRGASMRAKKLPVFYTPYLLWPVKTERASGFLVPQPGYSNRRGGSLSLAYFQTLGRSYDATFYADLYSKQFLGIGSELRYRPSEGTAGQVAAYAIQDPEQNDDWRYKITLDHSTEDLPWGLRGGVRYQNYSDFDYLRDFERDIDRNSIRSILSRGFVSGSWGTHSLNILAEDRETLVSGTNTVTQRRLPEAEYRLRPTQIGDLPLYLEMDSSLAYLSVARTERYDGSYGRVDLFPSLRVPLRLAPWLSLSMSAGYRYTWYGDSLCQQGSDTEGGCGDAGLGFTGDTLDRGVPTAGAEIVGPSFSRIFDGLVGKYVKFKHVIEPRFTYTFFDEVDPIDQAAVPLFDERDTLGSTNVGRIELVNRLLAKPEEGKGSAREILSLRIGQAYSFDDMQPLQQGDGMSEPWGPLSAVLRFDPGEGTSLQAQLSYNTLFSQLTQQALTAAFKIPRSTVGLTWVTRWNAMTGEQQSDQARVWSAIDLVPKKLRLQAQLNYNIDESDLTQQRYVLGYTSQCYALQIEARELTTIDRTDRDYRFLLTLKNVGTFLDLSGRQSTAGF